MKTINLKKENGMLVVSTPYNSEFVNRAKNLGGRWDAKNSTWVFDESVEDYVKQTLLDIFGVTGEANYETCSLIVKNFTKIVMEKGKNIKRVKITVPNEQVLKRLNSTPTFSRLSRLRLNVGENIENVNHKQFSDMNRLYPIIGVSIEEII